jgi:hypothetical protein
MFSTDQGVLDYIAREEQSTIASTSIRENYVGEAPQWFLSDDLDVDTVRYSWSRPRDSKYSFTSQIKVCHDNTAIYGVYISDVETENEVRTGFFVLDLSQDRLPDENAYEYFHRQFDPFADTVLDSIESGEYE